MSATDSENEHLSGSHEVRGYESGDESSSSEVGSSTESDSSRSSERRALPGKVVATGGVKRGSQGERGHREGKGAMERAGGQGKGPKGGKWGKGRKGQPMGLRIPTMSCAGSASGWLDPVEKFVNTPPNVDREAYFRTYGKACRYKPGGAKIPDNVLGDMLKGLEYVHKECAFNRDFSGALRYAFQIPEGYEIRLPEPGEFIYQRGGDLCVGIPLEHFRAGLRLPMHRFFHTLLVNMRLGLGQLDPNSIRKICAFIARCTELGREPTLSLF